MTTRRPVNQKGKALVSLKFEKIRTKIESEYQNKLREKQAELSAKNNLDSGYGQSQLRNIQIGKVKKLAEGLVAIDREVYGDPASEKEVSSVIERVGQHINAYIKDLISKVASSRIILANSKQGYQEQLRAEGMGIIANIKRDLLIVANERKRENAFNFFKVIFLDRFKKLTLWKKIGVFGALASIATLIISLLPKEESQTININGSSNQIMQNSPGGTQVIIERNDEEMKKLHGNAQKDRDVKHEETIKYFESMQKDVEEIKTNDQNNNQLSNISDLFDIFPGSEHKGGIIIHSRKSAISKHYEIAVKLFKEGKIKESKQRLNLILQKDPKHANSLNLLAVIHYKENQIKKSLETFQNAYKCSVDIQLSKTILNNIHNIENYPNREISVEIIDKKK